MMPLGSKRLLHAPHEIELHRIRVALELEDFQLADAVFGGKAAAELLHEIVDGALHLLFHGLQLRNLGAGALIDVEVQVAIAQVAVRHEHALRNVLRHPGRRDFDEARHLRHRHGDVVLEAGAVLALRLGNGFAQPPEGFALAIVLRHGRIGDPLHAERVFERLLRDIASSGSSAREEESSASTYHGDGADSGSHDARNVARGELDADARNQLERGHAVAAGLRAARLTTIRRPSGSRTAMNAVARERSAG